jgi:hypothetical protein
MNLDYEKQLEAEIDRQLKALPPLTAPPTLASRVMAGLETRTARPWFSRAWPAWPFALRTASLMTLLALFGGLTFAGWQLSHTGSDLVTRRFGGDLSLLGAIWDVLSALVGAVAVLFKNLSPMFLIGYLAALTFGYVMCLGIGTLGMKVALARR